MKLRAACPGWCRGGWQAALTKPGHSSTARWGGSGERGGKEYARNRRFTSLKARTGSNLADMGRERRAPARHDGRGTPGLAFNGWPGGHGEVLRGSRGEVAGAEP